MKFIDHIQEIDERMEDRREDELQKILFDFDADAGSLFGLGVSHTVPMPNGGMMRYDQNNMPNGFYMPGANGSTWQYDKHGVPQSYSLPKVNGGRIRYTLYKPPKPTLGGR